MRYSVVIPYGNARDTIRACLRSVLAAADRFGSPCEIICANGGSDDGTDALVAEAAARDPRIVPLLGNSAGTDPKSAGTGPNSAGTGPSSAGTGPKSAGTGPKSAGTGPGPARNRGLAAAHGDYLVFVDADDTLDADALVRLADATADIVTFLPPAGAFDLSRPKGRRRTFSPLVGNLLVWNAAYRREAVAGLEFPDLVNHEDLVWTCAAYARAKTLVGGAAPWYRHDANVAGSAVHTHSWRRVRAAWAATAMMWRAVRPAFAAGPLVLRLVMARKMAMHLLLHCLKEVFLASRPGRRRKGGADA